MMRCLAGASALCASGKAAMKAICFVIGLVVMATLAHADDMAAMISEEMEKADQKNDTKALEALGTKADSLAQQIGPEYAKVMDGLEEVDPNSAEGKQYTAMFATLAKQCK